MLGNELGGEETKQGNDRESERYPIEPCIERYTEHRTHKGKDRAQNHLVERVREEQDDQQRADGTPLVVGNQAIYARAWTSGLRAPFSHFLVCMIVTLDLRLPPHS